MPERVFTCLQILNPTMNKWAQYPAENGSLDIALSIVYTQLGQGKTLQTTFYNFSSPRYYMQFRVLVYVMRG